MRGSSPSGGTTERYYTRIEVAEAAGVSYAQIRHWQETGLIESEAVASSQASPGAVQHLFPERSLRRAIHIAQLRRAGMSLQAIAQLLGFIAKAGPQPLFLSSGAEPAMVLVSPQYVESVLGLLDTCGARGGKEVKAIHDSATALESDWFGHALDTASLDGDHRRVPMIPRRLNRREFLRVTGLSATVAAATACSTPAPAPGGASTEPEATAAPAQETQAPTVEVRAQPGAKYAEAPSLADRVAAGDLPPVEERLPVEPLVVPVTEEIGQYGGVWHRCAVGASDAGIINSRLSYENLIRWNDAASDVVPNVAKSFEVNDDATEFTFYLREGMKWSDGAPFTADDFVFWYDDVLLNEELTPTFPSWMRDPAGEPVVLEKVDDYTIRFTTQNPYGLLIQVLASSPAISICDYPRHYLEQFHPKYADADDLAEAVKAAQLENWTQLFALKRSWQNPEQPHIWAWIPTRVPPDLPMLCERNPYYWKVDPEGNQLPYIDSIQMDVVENADLLNLKAVAGEIDMQLRHILWTNYPLFIENAEQGNYRVIRWTLAEGSNCTLFPNLNHMDEGMRALMQNLDFRVALSLGINRSEINELAYQGMGEPRQASLIPECPYFKEEHAAKYADFDPDQANQMLDSIGLTEMDGEGYRLRPDGQPLSIAIDYAPLFGPWRDAIQMISEQWKAIGIRALPSEADRTLIVQRTNANEYDMSVWTLDYCIVPFVVPRRFMPANDTPAVNAPLWWQWYESGGKQGEEPPAGVKSQYELYDRIKGASADQLPELAAEFFDNASANLWNIGTVGCLPHVGVVKNNLRNVPEQALSDWQLLTPANTKIEQYFFKAE